MIQIKNAKELDGMRKANALSAAALKYGGEHIEAGMTTWELDKLIYDFIVKHGGTPNFKGLYGFPGTACISLNDTIIHGIPSHDIVIRPGDIVSIDAGLIYKGMHSDAARTHAVGQITPEAQKLIDVTRQSFFEGIKKAVAGNHLFDISNAIADYVEPFGYGIVEELVGHGIGHALHEDPQIPNFRQKRKGIRLMPGMTLAIEPMINAGTWEVAWLDDDWTVVTDDGSLSAHYENTILITDGEPEILTLTL